MRIKKVINNNILCVVDDKGSEMIVTGKGLGGKANLSDMDCCATRLRIPVIDADKVSDALLKQSGAFSTCVLGEGAVQAGTPLLEIKG